MKHLTIIGLFSAHFWEVATQTEPMADGVCKKITVSQHPTGKKSPQIWKA